jgi:hypothetical protein
VEVTEGRSEEEEFVHRPKTLHWLYVLRRSEVKLKIR